MRLSSTASASTLAIALSLTTFAQAGTKEPHADIWATAQDGVLVTGEVFYAVFNLGLAEADHGAAVAWVESNLVPSPGAAAVLGLAGLMARRRRR